MERAPKNEAMMGRKQESSFRTATITGCLALVIGLALIAGCATGKATVVPAQPAPAAAAKPAPALKSPAVVHLGDGREGFVIKEPTVAAKVRGEFDQANELIKDAKYDKAIELLEKVIAESPKVSAPHINAAIAYERINKPEQAEQHLKKALELIPGHPVASNEYGLLLRKGGRFAESRQVYEKSLERFPEYYPIHKNLGILCDLYLKDAACASEQYAIYGQAVPTDKQVKFWLADLRSRTGGQNMAASAATQNGP